MPRADAAVAEDLSCLIRLQFEDAVDDLPDSDPQRLRALLDHCLHQPMEFSLAALDRPQAEQIRREVDSRSLLLKSLGDLFAHDCPPELLLRAAKEFGRAHALAAVHDMPPDVTRVLYYASIVAARVRIGSRITELKDTELIAGVQWVLEQTWVNDSIKSLMREGLHALTNTEPISPDPSARHPQ
jgi:hypothetical protein